jgi:hypothetical protein
MSIWTQRSGGADVADVTGWDVEALDGSVGKIDEATAGAGDWVVVDTGFWIFGKKRVLPESVVDRVDATDHKVYVNRTKAEIKDAPDWDERLAGDEAYRRSVDEYYGHR